MCSCYELGVCSDIPDAVRQSERSDFCNHQNESAAFLSRSQPPPERPLHFLLNVPISVDSLTLNEANEYDTS